MGFGTTRSGGPSVSKARFRAPALHGFPDVMLPLRFDVVLGCMLRIRDKGEEGRTRRENA